MPRRKRKYKMKSKTKTNTFWKPGMIISVAMFILFLALILSFALKPEMIGSKFTASKQTAMEKWITILAIKGEPVKDIRYIKGGYPFYCYKDKESFQLAGHRQANLPAGKIFISEYFLKTDSNNNMLIKLFQGKNIKRIIEPREKIKGAVVKVSGGRSAKTTVRYLTDNKKPYEYAITINKKDADLMAYVQSPIGIKDIDYLASRLSAFALCD